MCKIKTIVDIYKNKSEEIKDFSKNGKKELLKIKNGVYAFYNFDKLLYVGMVSGSKTSSLYARMYSNGNARHELKDWFSSINKVYFYKLETEDKYDIMVLERILIRELKPKYNDLVFDDEEIEKIIKEMQ